MHQGDEHGKAQLHRLDVSVTRLTGGLEAGAALQAVLRIRDPGSGAFSTLDLGSRVGFFGSRISKIFLGKS
jgi:hypothetical protein